MRNRIKCKLCQDVIESISGEEVECSCKHIAVRGMWSNREILAIDFKNVIGIEDDGSESDINVIESRKNAPIIDDMKQPPTDVLFEITEMIRSFERLPPHATMQPLTQVDLFAVLLLMTKLVHELRESKN